MIIRSIMYTDTPFVLENTRVLVFDKRKNRLNEVRTRCTPRIGRGGIPAQLFKSEIYFSAI